MISVFPAGATDFSKNGECVLEPLSCQVNETLNGEWELQLAHPLDDWNKWTWLQAGNIIKAPVPSSMTPRVKLMQASEGKSIYRINTNFSPLNLWDRPSRYRSLAQYKKGLDVQVISTANPDFYEVIAPDGKRGWMASEYLLFLRTELTNAAATGQVVEPRQLRDQPFRIYRVVPELTQVTAYARHIFYDLLDNMIYQYKPANGTAGNIVAEGIMSACETEHLFNIFSDITKGVDGLDVQNTNPVEAFLGEGGLIDLTRGELARDWFDVFAMTRVGSDTDIQIRQGKNLLGISYDVDDSNVVTRIVPTGETKDGELLYLEPKYVDSPHIGDYPRPRWIHLPVSEAKVSDDMTVEQAQAKLLQAAQDEFERGCDLPDISIDVDFLNLADTEEYAQYKPLMDIFIGDSVWVIVQKLGFEVALRMTEYSYDCLLRRYTKMTLGSASETMAGSMISPRQLPAGGIKGVKLSMGSVGSGHLQALSVGALQVKQAAIDVAHIKDATIETLKANSVDAVRATIQELVAGKITTDQLWADLAEIAVAQLTTANIEEANISWADITHLVTAFADIAVAEIGSAKIGFAQIFDLQADTALIEKGIGGKFFFEELNILDANIVSLQAGQILVHGQDGSMYQLTVNEEGEVVPVLRHIVGNDVDDFTLDASMKLVKSSITADCLNVGEIFAAEALIAAIKAGNIDAGAIETSHLSAGAREALLLDAEEAIQLTAGGLRHEIANNAGQQMVLRFETGAAWEAGQESLVAYVTVWRNGLDVTSIIRPSAFHWERDSKDAVADAAWKALSSHHGVTSVNLTRDEIGDSCVLRCICEQAALFGTIEIDNEGVAWYIPEDGRPEEKFTLTPEGLLEGDGRYSINVDGELVAEVYMDAMQVETTTFDHSVLKTSHVLVKDDKIDIITGGTLNMKGADINLSAGGKLKMTSASDIVIGTENDLGTYIDGLMDHKNTIFYESGVPYPPIALAKGDLWYVIDSVPKKIYRASAPGGTNWVDVTTDVLAEALAKAEAARGLADTKALVFIQNDPPTQGMENGDLWVDADGGRLVYVYNNGWQALKSNGAITNSIVLDDNGILVKSGGNVKIQANGNFDVDSGGAVRINAGDGVDSYIRLGQGNFSASRDGGVVAEMGSFNQNLSVRGKEVWSKFNLIVSASQPTGNGIIWLQPNATSSVVYSLYTGPNRSIYWSNATPSRGFALDAESSSAVLANGTFKYRLKIVFYETLENRTNVSINAVLTKGGNTVNLGTYVLPSIRQWEEKTVEFEVQSTVNLCGDTTDINLTVNAAPGSSGGFFLQRYNYITLTVTNIASSGSAQACNIFWLP